MNTLWTTEPDAYLEPKLTESGAGAITPKTCIQVFQETVAKHGTRPALHLKRPVNVRNNCNIMYSMFSYKYNMLFFHHVVGNHSISPTVIYCTNRVCCQMIGKFGPGSSIMTTVASLPNLLFT